MTWLVLVAVLSAYVVGMCLLATFTGRVLKAASGCTCRKGAIDFFCPRHGDWSR